MSLEERMDVSTRLSWDVRFNNAINRYASIQGLQAEIIPAVVKGLDEWSANLPYKSCDEQGCFEPAHTWGLGAEATEIYGLVDWLILRKRSELANSLRKKYEALCRSAQALDELYPKTSSRDEETEQRLVKMCRRQAAQLNSFLEGLYRVAFKYSCRESRVSGPTECKVSRGSKRSQRVVQIELLEKALKEHINSARQSAHADIDAGKNPSLLPRPSKTQLSQQTGIRLWSLSRCFSDPNAHKLNLLWELANDLEQIIRFKRL